MTPERSQKGHSVSCMTILFISKCKSADRTSGRHKVGCQPGDFAYGHFNLPLGFVWVYRSFCWIAGMDKVYCVPSTLNFGIRLLTVATRLYGNRGFAITHMGSPHH